MVDYVSNSGELRRNILRYAFTEADQELADKLQTIPGSEADVLGEAAEIMWAFRPDLDDAGLRVMAEVWLHANEQGWTNLTGGPKGSNNRAEQIIAYASILLGDTLGDIPKGEGLPEPQTARRADRIDWRLPTGDE